MYIMREGTAVACIRGDQGEVEVKRYGEGDFFGEIALLTGEPRRASVYALGPATCMYIARDTFARVLGPLRDFLVRNIDEYKKYQEAIAASADEEYERGRSFASGDNSPVVHAPSGGKTERRRRSRTQKEMGQILERGVTSKVTEVGGTASVPASLADKVAQDFNNPALVTPCDKFALSSKDLQLYGGLRPGEKFTVDKSLIQKTPAVPATAWTTCIPGTGPRGSRARRTRRSSARRGRSRLRIRRPTRTGQFFHCAHWQHRHIWCLRRSRAIRPPSVFQAGSDFAILHRLQCPLRNGLGVGLEGGVSVRSERPSELLRGAQHFY
ncbi:unnamed protein product [Prorocentrum cordatum]|uniref:Cyclic nucleotide-binding domain-containing protein n=1 Tax=Prorocentrum cordatum TaxID=2364126 RepID=A0ABN9YC67_9DINO|nr:unnamed protein product [Polarella glacialis]